MPLNAAGWTGRIRGDWADRLTGDPLQRMLTAPHHVIRDRPTARTLLVRCGDTYVFAKHMTGRKDRAGGLRRLWHQWLYHIRISPAMNTLRITQAAQRADVHMPGVIAAARRRIGAETEDLLILEAIQGLNVRTRIFDAADDAARLTLADHVGRAVAHLHQSGFIHGDLLLGNLVMLDDRSPVYFVDNERTRRGRRWADRRKNLTQLVFRMLTYRRFGHTVARRMLISYTDAMGFSDRLARRVRLVVMRRVRQRFVSAYGGRSALWRKYPREKERGPQVHFDLHSSADDHR
jgi:tRNA A-37 threonylcarbamoyl transferase component Bud32